MSAKRFPLLLILILTVVACSGEQGPSRPAAKSIIIGIALPQLPVDDLFLEGAQLAVKQINDAGGIAGQPLVLATERETPPRKHGLANRMTADAGRELAVKLAAHKPLAVIGHIMSESAVAASQIYQDRKILFFAPYATNDSLTAHRFDLVFRMTLPNRSITEAIARYAYNHGYCRMLVYWLRNQFGDESFVSFKKNAEEQGINILFSSSFQPETENFQDLLLLMLDNELLDIKDIDAIFFIGYSTHTGNFIREARRLGFTQPILGGSLNNPVARRLAGEGMNNLVTFTFFDQQVAVPQRDGFLKAFKNEYRKEPSELAARAFDVVHLIAQAIKDTDTTDPDLIAHHLRTLAYTTPYQGATGAIAFDLKGELIGKAVNIAELRDGRFEIVAQLPTSTDRSKSAESQPPSKCRPH